MTKIIKKLKIFIQLFVFISQLEVYQCQCDCALPALFKKKPSIEITKKEIKLKRKKFK
jgi:hypothetical protein